MLVAANMIDCNSVPTPSSTVPLSIDADGPGFNEDWRYITIVGMLMYLAQNFRPDIAYAVHQCARFAHDPIKSQVVEIKRILRYLQGTKDNGFTLNLFEPLQVD